MNSENDPEEFLGNEEEDSIVPAIEEFTLPMSKGWLIAWILFYVYIACVVGFMVLITGGDTEAHMPRTIFFFFFPIFSFLAIKSHLTGLAPGKFLEADRDKDPSSFWMFVVVFWVLAAVCLVAGFGALLGYWK